MLIRDEFEQARVIVALLVSIGFLTLHVAIKPLARREDGALMLFVEVGSIFTYMIVLLIKVCDMSSVAYAHQQQAKAAAKAVCRTFGFGDTADGDALLPLSLTTPKSETCVYFAGVFKVFVFFALTLLLLLLIIAAVRIGIEAVVPKAILLTRAHSIPVTKIMAKVAARKCEKCSDEPIALRFARVLF